MNDVQVVLFGAARDLAGEGRMSLPAVPGLTTASLLEALVERHPALAPWKEFLRVAVNREYAAAGSPVSAGDEVAIIPPVSGG